MSTNTHVSSTQKTSKEVVEAVKVLLNTSQFELVYDWWQEETSGSCHYHSYESAISAGTESPVHYVLVAVRDTDMEDEEAADVVAIQVSPVTKVEAEGAILGDFTGWDDKATSLFEWIEAWCDDVIRGSCSKLETAVANAAKLEQNRHP